MFGPHPMLCAPGCEIGERGRRARGPHPAQPHTGTGFRPSAWTGIPADLCNPNNYCLAEAQVFSVHRALRARGNAPSAAAGGLQCAHCTGGETETQSCEQNCGNLPQTRKQPKPLQLTGPSFKITPSACLMLSLAFTVAAVAS